MNLDKLVQDPQRYLTQTLASASLHDIIAIHKTLDQEISLHDHQIQSLVFQNYTKFIGSIDTVRKMKQDIAKIDPKLQALQQSMNKISQIGSQLDKVLGPRRVQIVKLDTVNRDLKKLHSLCELPNILKTELAEFREWQQKPNERSTHSFQRLFSQSVQAFESCIGTLNQFKSEPMISSIYEESIGKIEQQKSILWSLLNKTSTSKFVLNSSESKFVVDRLLVYSEDPLAVFKSYWRQSSNRINQPPILSIPSEEFKPSSSDCQTVCTQFMQQALKLQALSKENNHFLNKAFWQGLEEELRFVKGLLQRHKGNPFKREKETDFVKLLDGCSRELFRKLTQSIEQNVLKLPCYLNVGMLELLAGRFEEVDWKVVQERLMSEKSIHNQSVLDSVLKFKQSWQTISYNQQSRQLYIQSGKLKQRLVSWVQSETLTICYYSAKARPPISHPSKFLDHTFFDKIVSIINTFIDFLLTPYSRLSQQTLKGLSLHRSKERLELVRGEESLMGRLIIQQFLTQLGKATANKLFNSVIQKVEYFLKQFPNEENIQTFKFAKQNFLNDILPRLQARFQSALKANVLATLSLGLQLILTQLHSHNLEKVMGQVVNCVGRLFPEYKRAVWNQKQHLLKDVTHKNNLVTEILLAKKAEIFQKVELNRSSAVRQLVLALTRTLYQLACRRRSPQLTQLNLIFQACYQLSNSEDQGLVKGLFVGCLEKAGVEWEQVERRKVQLGGVSRIHFT